MSKKPMLGVVVAPDPPAPPQAAPDAHDAQSMPTPPHLAPEAPPPASATPPQVAPDVPPPASATPPQVAPDVPPPATATPPQEAPAFPPPEAATAPKAVAGLSSFEPPPLPPKVVAGLGQQAPPPKVVASRRPSEGQPVQSFSGNMQRVPVSEPGKRDYLVAVKSYEQQVGANIVRGKMLIESLPTAPRAMPAERRFSPLPGTGYGQGMDMGHGTDYMYAPMSSGQGHPMGGGAPPNVQRSREEFRNLALGNDIDLAKMAEMGPEVSRLLNMGSHIDHILDVTNIPHAGRRPSGYAQPSGSTMAESYGRPPPTGYGAPMGRYSAEACPRDPRLYGPQEPRMGGRPIYEGPNCARRPCSRESTAYVEENRHTRRSMSRASGLSDRIRQDIDEHRAENMLEKIRADAASLDDGEPDVRIRPRNSMPHDSRPPSRNVRRASYDDDGRSDRRAHSKPRRRRSRHLEKSSSSSSSSVDRPRSWRSKRSNESKGKKWQSRSKKSSSSSSSSSSGSRSKPKPKGRSIEFSMKVTERFSSSSTGPEM